MYIEQAGADFCNSDEALKPHRSDGDRMLRTLRNIPQRETNHFFDFLFQNLDPLLQGIDLLSRAMQHSHNSTQIFR